MGAHTSKEELLYQEVGKGNHSAVQRYRRDGASLEWVDKEGRTPLILACTRHGLFNMVMTLLNLGANIDAYRTGSHGGFPLHHAAKKGLEKTVTLLLSRGADPFAVNDDGHTPLELARSRNHVSVVRLLEDRISLFTGMVWELSGQRLLQVIAPRLCTKKIWAVVIPIDSPGRKAPKYELAIYTSPKVAQPRTIIKLFKAQLGEPKFNSAEPIFYITDMATETKYKFLSEKEGDKAQLEKLYKACKGIPQVQCGGFPPNSPVLALSPVYTHANACQIHPMSPKQSGERSTLRNRGFHHRVGSLNVTSPYKPAIPETVAAPDDMELALALDASIRSAAEQGIPIPATSSHASFTDYMWLDNVGTTYGTLTSTASDRQSAGAGLNVTSSAYSSTHPQQTGQQNLPTFEPQQASKQTVPTFVHGSNPTFFALPSAPPLPPLSSIDNQRSGRSFMPTPLGVDYSSGSGTRAAGEMSGTCVVCWDAPAEGVCIPCGHIASCMSCLSEIRRNNFGCPVCRVSIQKAIKVYAV